MKWSNFMDITFIVAIAGVLGTVFILFKNNKLSFLTKFLDKENKDIKNNIEKQKKEIIKQQNNIKETEEKIKKKEKEVINTIEDHKKKIEELKKINDPVELKKRFDES